MIRRPAAEIKSLMEFICEAVDEALPCDAGVTGRELYMRGFERYEAAHFEREMKRRFRELETAMPLLLPMLSATHDEAEWDDRESDHEEY
jgi:hypothetical protein